MNKLIRITTVAVTSTLLVFTLFALAVGGLKQIDIANNAVLKPWERQITGFVICLIVWVGLSFAKKQLQYLDGNEGSSTD